MRWPRATSMLVRFSMTLLLCEPSSHLPRQATVPPVKLDTMCIRASQRLSDIVVEMRLRRRWREIARRPPTRISRLLLLELKVRFKPCRPCRRCRRLPSRPCRLCRLLRRRLPCRRSRPSRRLHCRLSMCLPCRFCRSLSSRPSRRLLYRHCRRLARRPSRHLPCMRLPCRSRRPCRRMPSKPFRRLPRTLSRHIPCRLSRRLLCKPCRLWSRLPCRRCRL